MFVNPIALESIGWKYYFVFVVFLILFLVVSFFCYPETKGRTLEQMAFIFDGDDAEVFTIEGLSKVMTVQDTEKTDTKDA